MPPWPYRRGPQARAQLEELSIPLFAVDIRRLEAFEAAADGGRASRVGHGLEDAGSQSSREWGRGSGNRFGWLSDEEDPRVEEALREEAPRAGGHPAPRGFQPLGRRPRERPRGYPVCEYPEAQAQPSEEPEGAEK